VRRFWLIDQILCFLGGFHCPLKIEVRTCGCVNRYVVRVDIVLIKYVRALLYEEVIVADAELYVRRLTSISIFHLPLFFLSFLFQRHNENAKRKPRILIYIFSFLFFNKQWSLAPVVVDEYLTLLSMVKSQTQFFLLFFFDLFS
jgi:hypothetical protein